MTHGKRLADSCLNYWPPIVDVDDSAMLDISRDIRLWRVICHRIFLSIAIGTSPRVVKIGRVPNPLLSGTNGRSYIPFGAL